MKVFRAFVFSVAAFFAAAVSAGAEPLSLDQARAKAGEAHHDLVVARLESDAAKYGVTEAVGYYLPTGNVQEIYMTSNNPVMAFGADLNQGTFSLMEFQMSDPNEPEVIEDYITRFEVEQPVFAGGKITSGVVAATQMRKAARYGVEQQKLVVAQQVETAYYNALRAAKFVELTRQVVATMERHLKTAKDAFDAGLVLESEVLQAEVYLAKGRVALTESDNNRRLALAHLNFLMGEDQTRVWELSEPPTEDCAFPDTPALIETAWADRPDLAGMDHQVAAAKAGQYMTASAFLPTVGVKGQADFHDEDSAFGDQAEDWTVFVAAKWELFSGFKDASRTAGAVKKAKIAETRRRQMREGAALEVRKYSLELDASKKKLATAETAVTQAERHLEIMSNRHEQGLIKIAELLDAQTAETEARTYALNAAYDLVLAQRALLHAVGSTTCQANP